MALAGNIDSPATVTDQSSAMHSINNLC